MTQPAKRRRLFTALTAICLLGGSTTTLLSGHAALAQVVTFDPQTYAQTLLTAARSLQQINNQITMLQNQAQSLTNQNKNLTSLPFSTLTSLQQNLSRTSQLMAQAQRIAYSVSQVDQAFSSTYGNVSVSASDASLINDANTRWQNTVAGLQDSMRTQATVVGNISTNQAQIAALVQASQSATGALAATQAGNQLLALQAQELADLTALIAANGRAEALRNSETATSTAQSQEQRRRFLSSTGTYTAGNAQMFYGN